MDQDNIPWVNTSNPGDHFLFNQQHNSQLYPRVQTVLENNMNYWAYNQCPASIYHQQMPDQNTFAPPYQEDSHDVSSYSDSSIAAETSYRYDETSSISSHPSPMSSGSPCYVFSNNNNVYNPMDSSKVRKHRAVKVRRSRMGCLTCRNRKKRCCEARPECTECARLGLSCVWPAPGTEHRNRPRNSKILDGLYYDEFHGHIKILRGIVESKINVN